MTIRTDVSVNFGVSPRIISIQAPSVDITLQDLHDTLNNILQLPQNQSYPRLILSAGKEDLGGGTLVGITSTLQDAQLSFDARTIVLESGTETVGGDNKNLTDGVAAFVTNSVARGDLVFNVTDGSSASVIRVVSETQLITTGLTGGALNVYTLGDSYVVYDVIQCNISGGNLVAIDALGASLDPVFTTFGTQVVRTASSSATISELLTMLTQLKDIWQERGLDIDNPMTVTPNTRIAGDVDQTITGDGSTTTTVTRNP